MPTDIFYFQSPIKPQIVHKRQHKISRASITARKKGRNIRMTSLPQRAMMARFDEPTFCPTDLAGLINQYPILLSGSPESNSASAASPSSSDDDAADNEDGGVSLTGFQDREMSDAPHAQDASVAPGIQRSETSTSSLLSLVHQRPDTPDIWAEEDSRRLRFALDGDNIADVPQFMHAEDTLIPDTQRTSQIWTRSIPSHSQIREPISHRLEFRQTPRETPDHRDAIPVQLSRSRTAAVDDCLDVHDHSRNYDVSEFVDVWRLRPTTDRSVPPFGTGIEPLAGPWWPPPDLVIRSKDLMLGTLDIQGICWANLGTTRENALQARTLLHPSECQVSTAVKGRPQQHSPQSKAAYRFRSFAAKHRTHICHYQLRNSIAAIGRSDIFYADRSRVFSTSLASPTSQNPILDLAKPHTSAANFRVTCLVTSSTSSNLLFAGGFLGEYAMLNLDAPSSSQPIEGFVTHAYNGLVTHIETSIGRSSGQPQATFCSNDKKVRILDAATGKFTDTFSYAHAVNCSAVSTDSRLRLLVGDTHDSCITTAERGDVVVNLGGHTDHTFACAWAPNGVTFATGSQDGKTLVWDARNWSHPVEALESTYSCPRSLHFADDSSLIVAEHEDVVSVYAAGTFEKRQDIRFFGAVAGVAVIDGGEELVVANADQSAGGLLAFERNGLAGREGGRMRRTRDDVKPPARKSRSTMFDGMIV